MANSPAAAVSSMKVPDSVYWQWKTSSTPDVPPYRAAIRDPGATVNGFVSPFSEQASGATMSSIRCGSSSTPTANGCRTTFWAYSMSVLKNPPHVPR
jgi:hypothetical protein